MTARQLLWRDDGRLRTGWALARFALLLVGGAGVAWAIAALAPLEGVSRQLAVVWAPAVGAGAATWVAVRLDRRSWRYAGWPGGGVRWWWVGLGEGVALVSLAGAACWAAGLRWSWAGVTAGSWLAGALPLLGVLGGAALVEELAFRGYPLMRALEGWGPGIALGGLAVLFAALHLGNPDLTAWGLANIALAGVWLGLAFWRTRSLPLVWGLHVGWNWTLVAAFGFDVSGFAFDPPAGRVVEAGPVWVTGGEFGPEGGLSGTVALGAGLTRWLLWPVPHAEAA